MATLQARPDFDWSRVKWGGPDDPVSDVCPGGCSWVEADLCSACKGKS